MLVTLELGRPRQEAPQGSPLALQSSLLGEPQVSERAPNLKQMDGIPELTLAVVL